MAMFVHLTPEKNAKRIARSGIRCRRSPVPDGRVVFAMPITRSYYISNQWLRELKRSGQRTFYMGDPDFFDAYVALYFGKLVLTVTVNEDGTRQARWRAEMPWKWPSYEEMYETHGDYHAQCFTLPNARSLVQGGDYGLKLDDGLGGYLEDIGLAKSFLVVSEWGAVIDNKDGWK